MNLNATILGQAISFFLFVWFCMKYIWPPIILAIETRQKEIKESLLSSENAQKKLHEIQKQIHHEMKEAKEKALMILNSAHEQKQLILDKARKTALKESKRIFLKNQSEMAIELTLVRKNLHKEIVDLSILMAEKIIKKNIQKNEHQDLIDELIISLAQVKK